jgi:hypothetical protein
MSLQTKKSSQKKFSLSKAADAYSKLLKFAKIQPRYSAQEVMQLHVLHLTFLWK